MSSIYANHPGRWNRLVVSHRSRDIGSPTDILALLRLARDKDVLILLGSVGMRQRYRDFVLAALVQLAPGRPRPRILLTDATWEPASRALGARTGLPATLFGLPIRLFVRLIDAANVRYAVLSTDELTTFPQTWGVAPERVVFTPFPATVGKDTPHALGDYLFAGGNSLRDHATLADALARSGVVAQVATSAPRPRALEHVDWGWLDPEVYRRRLAGAWAVVVPLLPAVRSCGQQTYLNAMLMEKPVIVSDVAGARDYIEDGVTGVLVPPGDPAALAAAIRDVVDPARREHYVAMGRRARRGVLARGLDLETYFDQTLLAAAGVPVDW